jgi:hypothetical protein
MKRFLSGFALSGALLGAGVVAAGITITPASYDYGKVAVRGYAYHDFDVSIPRGAGPTDTVTQTLTGADAAEFGLNTGGCERFWRTEPCRFQIVFQPKSVGHKVATLVVVDTRGNRGTAQLTGEAVEPVCTNEVVFCNYAHLYSGTFAWTSGVHGPFSQYDEHVQVGVASGVATCNGAATSVSQERRESRAINGTGLVAIQFVNHSAGHLVYRITPRVRHQRGPPVEW